MSAKTGIQWTDATWNPIRGCSRVSEGCRNCYAELIASRFSGPGQAYEGLARRRSNGEPQWTGEVTVIDRHMLDPLRWRTPRRIFVNSMSDLFHEKVRVETLDEIFAVMALAPHHTFQILTKRPERMLRYLSGQEGGRDVSPDTARYGISLSALGVTIDMHERKKRIGAGLLMGDDGLKVWPLPNVWLGVSVENQEAADERIPLLLQTPAAIRFLSCEPLLGALDLSLYLEEEGYIDDQYVRPVDWVIAGGESGKSARPCNVEWITAIVADCDLNGVACFVKQLGALAVDCELDVAIGGPRLPLRNRHGGDPAEWPEELRVREFPTIAQAASV
jgi:protein gp37